MSDWETLSDEASIVLRGNFNPRIFHAEWFIRKKIVGEWDYSSDNTIVSLPDMAQLALPEDRNLNVLLNKFQIRSSLASNYPALKDFVSSTFSILAETPVVQMGMNFNSLIRLADQKNWRNLGRRLAPPETWIDAADYVAKLEEKKQLELGLWNMTMNLPREDQLQGFVRATIGVEGQPSAQTLKFSINSHVELGDGGAKVVPRILNDHWDHSLDFSREFILRMMNSLLDKNP